MMIKISVVLLGGLVLGTMFGFILTATLTTGVMYIDGLLFDKWLYYFLVDHPVRDWFVGGFMVGICYMVYLWKHNDD